VILVSSQVAALKVTQQVLRKAILKTGALVSSFGLMTNAAFADLSPAPWNKDIKYEVIQSGKGDQPKVGDLVAVRFKGSYKGNVFDDTFSTDQPYFYRAGVGLILPGVDETIVNMHVGDKFKLNFGGELGFKV
jgi:FKBP-type peptidyl-prolyl cis-trans isomerase